MRDSPRTTLSNLPDTDQADRRSRRKDRSKVPRTTTCHSRGHRPVVESSWLRPLEFPLCESSSDYFSTTKTQSSSQTRGPEDTEIFRARCVCSACFRTSNKRCRPSCKGPATLPEMSHTRLCFFFPIGAYLKRRQIK